MSDKPSFDTNTDPDDFKVIRLLGCGGFGQVLEIVHVPTGKHYAGKLFQGLSESKFKEVNKEMDIMKSIYSEYTVNFYGTIKFPKSNPNFMIIMDYCDRGSLRDVMDYNEETLNEDQLSIVMQDLLKALSILRNKYETLHRDIKAANILMSSDCSLKVTDFGISRKFDKAVTVHTKSTMGTPYWMAPEVILSEKYSFPVDIWSVGATAVELIEGAPPYCEFPPSRAFNEIVANGFPGFRSNTVVSNELKDFVQKCMIYDANKRPTADQLLTHPFVRKAQKLDRKKVFEKLLSTEINFEDLIDDEDIESIKKIVTFEIAPEFNGKTNISQDRQTMKTFVKQAEPGAAVNTIYVKDKTIDDSQPQQPPLKEETSKQEQQISVKQEQQTTVKQEQQTTVKQEQPSSTQTPKEETVSTTKSMNPAPEQQNKNYLIIAAVVIILLLAFLIKH